MKWGFRKRRSETMDEFIDRAIQTRGTIEQTFWAQASKLKNLLDSVHPKGILQQMKYERAKERLKKANSEYLDDDVETAIKYQKKALEDLSKIFNATDESVGNSSMERRGEKKAISAYSGKRKKKRGPRGGKT